MQMAQHLGVSQAFKPESQVQPRGVSMIMSSEGGPVPYGHMMPQLATLQINSPVRIIIDNSNSGQVLMCVFPLGSQYISPPYPYYQPTIMPAMPMTDTDQASNTASPDEAYSQYQHIGGGK